jgi:hypothetical protein
MPQCRSTIDCVDDTIHATKYNKPCHSAQNTIDCVDDTIHATDIQINFLNDFKSYSVLKFIGNYSIDTLQRKTTEITDNNIILYYYHR